MKNLVNTLKQEKVSTLIGLTIVVSIIIPCAVLILCTVISNSL